MTYAKPVPRINADNRAFWEGCRQHELKFQQCAKCSQVRWPPSDLCPQCHSTDTDWLSSKGFGTVYTFAVYHAAFHPGFKADVPYTVAVVALDEGPRLLTNIVGCPPDQVRCDMPVEVTWQEVDEGITLPKFRPISNDPASAYEP